MVRTKISLILNTLSLVMLIFAVAACVEPFNPPRTAETTDILVVDGFLNATTNSARFQLSRANGLSQSVKYDPETGASVSIENDNGSKIVLVEKPGGVYELTGLTLAMDRKYKLLITRKGGRKYESDYIQLTSAGILDQVSWTPKSDGVTVHVDAHDPAGKTRYFKWNCTETYEYLAFYQSFYKLVDGVAYQRTPEENIYVCWKTDILPNIRIGATDRLSEARVHEMPLTFLPVGTVKLSRHYSIHVRQRGLTESEYDYWLQLQRTTENLGGLFDPLPGEVTGNIRRIDNSAEPVLGYFAGGTVTEKRLFIHQVEIPSYLQRIQGRPCALDSVLIQDLDFYFNGLWLVTTYGELAPIGYTYSSQDCVDCRTGGGVTKKPDFWP